MGFVIDVVLPLALAFIMFAIGLALVADDFRRVLRQPKDFLVGMLSQMVLLPLVAFLLASAFALDPVLAVGVMIIAAAPGGVTSNLLTLFAQGDAALSVSMTAVTSLLSALSVPFVVVLAHRHFMGGGGPGDISIAGTAVALFVIVTLPVLAGVLVRSRAPAFAGRIEPAARRLSGVLFVLVVLGAIVDQRANIVAYFAQAGAVTLALNLTMMALAYWGARLLGLQRPQRIAISLECGLQNGTLAIAVAATLFHDVAFAIPAAIYSLIMFATSLAFVFAVTRAPATGARVAR
jgi:bile acid:Na+ symporter, BASS family